MRNKQAMKDFVLDLLRNNLPENYYYHNSAHTIYVGEKAHEIGLHQQCTVQELELLSVAALWHDTGYIKTYKDSGLWIFSYRSRSYLRNDNGHENTTKP